MHITNHSLRISPLVSAIVAVAVGGVVGGATALGPLPTMAILLGLGTTYLILISIPRGIVLVFAIITLLPFATLPFKAIITPTILSLTLGGVLVVWILRALARSDRYDARFSPLSLPIFGFLGLSCFSLIRGAGGIPDMATLHNYSKFVLGVLFFFSTLNGLRSREDGRWILRGMLLCGGVAALIGLVLVALPDPIARRLLVSLSPIGYPAEGRVLRYVEDNPDGLERVISTSVDPNSFGGMLALILAIAFAQLFTAHPLLPRTILAVLIGVMGTALLLTFSRAALFGCMAAAVYLATLRYRRLWWVMLAMGALGTAILLGLGIGDDFTRRLSEGIQFRDQAQQMRLAEFRNAWQIITRYPIAGIGFGQAPEIDLVAGVSSIYLTIAERMGLAGLTAFLGIFAAWFVQTFRATRGMDDELASWMLGLQTGVVAALTVGLADHYFFNIEFSHMVALLWGTMGMGLAVGELPRSPESIRGS